MVLHGNDTIRLVGRAIIIAIIICHGTISVELHQRLIPTRIKREPSFGLMGVESASYWPGGIGGCGANDHDGNYWVYVLS